MREELSSWRNPPPWEGAEEPRQCPGAAGVELVLVVGAEGRASHSPDVPSLPRASCWSPLSLCPAAGPCVQLQCPSSGAAPGCPGCPLCPSPRAFGTDPAKEKHGVNGRAGLGWARGDSSSAPNPVFGVMWERGDGAAAPRPPLAAPLAPELTPLLRIPFGSGGWRWVTPRHERNTWKLLKGFIF